MTTPDLPALLSRLRAATGPDREIDQEMFCDLGFCPVDEEGVLNAYQAPRYTESIDAADALLTRLGLVWGKTRQGLIDVFDPVAGIELSSTGATLPIALCIGAVQHAMARGEG